MASLSSLLRAASIDDHDEVLKAANALLKTSKNNPDALHNRVVALLKLDRFDDALRALDDGGDKLAERCTLEKAYALYKTGKLAEAEELAQKQDLRGLKHVAAQVAYRAEKFEDAASIYRELGAQPAPIEGEENDLRINSAAVDAQLEWQGKGDKVDPSRKKPGREDLEAFETSYNAACGCIARGELSMGNVLLKRARDLCEALDELSDEDKRAEVLPIMVQQAYVFTKLGKLEQAETIQKMINIAEYVTQPLFNSSTNLRSVPEPPTRVIAQNNALASSTKNDNPFLTERIFDSVPKLSSMERHFEHQANILRRNRYIVDIQALKYEGVAHSTAPIISQAPSPTISPFITTLSALNAAAHAHGQTEKASLKQILPLLEKRPNDVGLLLTICQLYILLNKPGPAIALLESFFKRLEESNTPTDLDVRFSPGLVALAVSLYRLSGRKAPIRTELANAATHWRSRPSAPAALLLAAGSSLLESSRPEDISAAGEVFSALHAQDPNDRSAIAGLVASYATSDPSRVSSDLDKLTPVSKLISGIDASALESAGIPTLAAPASSKKRPAPADDEEAEKEKEKPAKKRKIPASRMPKDFVEGKAMDPERWLPLRDRSTYRPKGKKAKKKALDMTQGGVVREEESLELAGGAGSVKVEKAGGGGGAKKKKKGKK